MRSCNPVQLDSARRRRDAVASRQRGAVSVEVALVTPLLLMIILGGVHLGRALGTRHRVADATGFATRAAALSGNTAAANVRALVQGRMGTAAAQCASLDVVSTVVGVVPNRRIEVTAKCTLPAPFGANLLAAIGAFPSDFTVSAAMPF
jgi:Flp pilus assembly protein TadG